MISPPILCLQCSHLFIYFINMCSKLWDIQRNLIDINNPSQPCRNTDVFLIWCFLWQTQVVILPFPLSFRARTWNIFSRSFYTYLWPCAWVLVSGFQKEMMHAPSETGNLTQTSTYSIPFLLVKDTEVLRDGGNTSWRKPPFLNDFIDVCLLNSHIKEFLAINKLLQC